MRDNVRRDEGWRGELERTKSRDLVDETARGKDVLFYLICINETRQHRCQAKWRRFSPLPPPISVS